MAIPDFQAVMLPLLRLMDNGNTYQNMETIEPLAREFSLSEDDRAQLIPSGRMSTFHNRIAWARTYLFQAGLIERVSRGRYRISERGLGVLRNPPNRIDINFLHQFPEFQKFRSSRNDKARASKEHAVVLTSTPFELMDSSYRELRQQLAQELLHEIKASPPSFFEQLVVDLLVAMGYGGSRDDAGQAVGGSSDGGIDGIIKEDRLGLDAIYLQAKRWENPVGRPVVQGFAGSLEGHRARKGIMITTSTFTPGAQEYVGMIEKKIVLIDGEQLAQLMIDHGIGVSEIETYRIHRVDSDYFNIE